MGNESAHPKTHQVPIDEGLRCPTCKYNLTGLVDRVCPECGTEFDRDRMLEDLRSVPAPIPIWSQRRERGFLLTFTLQVLEVWIHPLRLVIRFPPNVDAREARSFSRWCLIVAMVLFVIAQAHKFAIASIFQFRPRELIDPLMLAIGTVLGLYLTEWAIVSTAFIPWSRFERKNRWFRQSLALVHMLRAFSLLMAVVFFGCWATYNIMGQLDSVGLATIKVCFVAMIYCWACIAIVVGFYRRSFLNFALAIILIPIGAILCFGLSMLGSGILGYALLNLL